MNTFVPYPDFKQCAQSLDNKRLGKQVAECGQILRQVDIFPRGGWSHHPAIRMWVGFDEALFAYMKICHDEWLSRGFNYRFEMRRILKEFPEYEDLQEFELPPWWGNPDVHSSHCDNLYRKSLGLPHLPYVWPLPL